MTKLYSLRLYVLLVFVLISSTVFGQINTPSGAIIPFGSNKTYAGGLLPSNLPSSGTYGTSTDAANAYNAWKATYIEACGTGSPQQYRVRFDDPSKTVSEGIGYGMLLAAYAADKTLFDGLWAYYKAHMNGNGVMDWTINGCSGVASSGGATDAELDAAAALCVAQTQWPLSTAPYTYQTEALSLITTIRTKEMDQTTYQVRNGDGWNPGLDCRNPSYHAPGYFRLFATVDASNANFWSNAATAAYTLITANANSTTGLVSDWSGANGATNNCQTGSTSGQYGYDACRNPWRMATDVAWWGNTTAATGQTQCNKIATYISGKGATNVGGPVPQAGGSGGHYATFVSTFAAGCVGSTNQTILDQMYGQAVGVSDLAQNANPSGYFGNTLRCISLFMLTGNFWKPGSSPNQEINVQQNGINISSNGTYDLGNIQQGTNINYTFTIQNLGQKALTVGAVTFSGTDASKFSVVTTPATTVAANTTTTLVIKLTQPSGSTGAISATMSIVDNDSDENPYVIKLTATATQNATAPVVSVDYHGSVIASGNSPAYALGVITQSSTGINETGYYTFNITNTGTAPLAIQTIAVTGTANGYTISAKPTLPATVAVGATATFTVSVLANTTTGTQTGQVTITSTGLPNYVINLTTTIVSCTSSITTTHILTDYEGEINVKNPYNPTGPFNTATSNPAVNTINPTPICAKYTRRTADKTYDGIRYTPVCGTGTSPYVFDVTTIKGISMLVYSPAPGIPVVLSAKNSAGNAIDAVNYTSDLKTSTTKTNGWEKLFFDLTPLNGSTAVTYFDLQFDPTLSYMTAAAVSTMDIYIDQIQYENPPCITDLPSSQVFMDYDAHRNLSLLWLYTGTSTLNEAAPNPSATGLNTSPTVAKFVRSTATGTTNSQGWRYVGCQQKIDFSNKTVISMLVYSGKAGIPISMSIVNNAATPASIASQTVNTTVANTWERLYFDFTSIKGNTTGAYIDIAPDPQGANVSTAANLTYYFDDIRYDVLPCPPAPTVAAVGNTTFCTGGSVQLNASFAGVAGVTYAYQWYNGTTLIASATTASYTATDAGSYTVTVVGGGCTLSSATPVTVTVNTAPATPTVSASGALTICSNQTLTLSVSNANANATYQWLNGTTAAGTGTSYSPTATGSYTVVATLGGCTATSTASSVTVNTAPAVPTITAGTSTTFCDGGSVTLTGASTTANVSYQWSNASGAISGATAATYIAKSSGNYTVTATLGTCSATSAATTVTVNPLPTLSPVTVSPASICVGSTSTLTAAAAGGTGTTYTYNWGTASTSTTASITVSPATVGDNTYSVTATDSKGCTSAAATATVKVTSSGAASVAIASNAPNNNVCAGTAVIFTATPTNGGTPTYKWYVDNALQASTSETLTLSSLAAGSHAVYAVMTSSISCVTGSPATSSTVSVTVNAAPTVNVAASSNGQICAGASATVTATPAGGTAPYTYSWTGATGTGASVTVNPSATTTYSVVVKDANNCSSTAGSATVTVNPLPSVTASANPSNICVGSTSTLTAAAAGGTGTTYTYNWGTASTSTTASITVSPATVGDNTYSVTATDSKGCTSAAATATVKVTSSGAASVAIASNAPNNVCAGTAVIFTATPTNGGTPTYKWYVDNALQTSTSETLTLSSLAAGSHVVYAVMTSSISCVTGSPATSSTVSVTVNATPTVNVAASSNGQICAGASATVTATPAGGTAPYTYTWTGATGTGASVAVSPSATATYSVVVKDANNCSSTAGSATVTVNPLPSVSVTPASSDICTGGSATLVATGTGGTGPYSYTWDGLTDITASVTVSPTATKTYAVSVTDAKQCTSATKASAVVNVTTGGAANVSIGNNLSVCEGKDAVITATPVNGGNPTYKWYVDNNLQNQTGGTLTLTSPAAGQHEVYVIMTSSIACATGSPVTSTKITVTVNPTPLMTLSSPSPVCEGISVSMPSAPSGLTLDWQPSIGNGTITPVAGTITYTVIGTDPNGCKTQPSTVTVTAYPKPVLSLNHTSETICSGGSLDLVATVTSGTAPYQYAWEGVTASASASSVTVSPATNATYSLQVTDANQCTSAKVSATVTVNNSASPAVTISSNLTTVCPNTAVTFTATAIAAGNTPSYQWYVNSQAVGTNSNTYSTSTLAAGDIVKVTVTSTLTCTSGQQASAQVSVSSTGCGGGGNITISGPVNPTEGTTVIYSVPTTGNTEFVWHLPPGSQITSSNSDGSVITVLVGSINGTITVTEIVKGSGNPGTPTGNSGSMNVSVATGILDKSLAGIISINPNPSEGMFNISLSQAVSGTVKITVRNMVGEVVYSDEADGTMNAYSLNIEELPGGVYFLEIGTMDKVGVKRLVKQ